MKTIVKDVSKNDETRSFRNRKVRFSRWTKVVVQQGKRGNTLEGTWSEGTPLCKKRFRPV